MCCLFFVSYSFVSTVHGTVFEKSTKVRQKNLQFYNAASSTRTAACSTRKDNGDIAPAFQGVGTLHGFHHQSQHLQRLVPLV